MPRRPRFAFAQVASLDVAPASRRDDFRRLGDTNRIDQRMTLIRRIVSRIAGGRAAGHGWLLILDVAGG